jgi:hypothetical protein
LQGDLTNDQISTLVTFIKYNSHDPRMCNSICLAASTVASKGNCAAVRANAREVQMMNKVLHYEKVVPMYRSWMSTALVATRKCNTCGRGENVRRGDFYCQVCKPITTCFHKNLLMMKK